MSMMLNQLDAMLPGAGTPWCTLRRAALRVVSTRTQPLPVAGEAEAPEEEGVDGVAQEDLREGVLAVGGIEELLDGLVRELEEFLAGEAGLELLDLILDPEEVPVSRGDGRTGNHGRRLRGAWGRHKGGARDRWPTGQARSRSRSRESAARTVRAISTMG